jgi:hypothetical protein
MRARRPGALDRNRAAKRIEQVHALSWRGIRELPIPLGQQHSQFIAQRQ